MAIEKTDLLGGLTSEQTAPVAATPQAKVQVQGQASPEEGQSKERRREPSSETDASESEVEDSDRSPHRVDSIA
jgi:hypothetical protein